MTQKQMLTNMISEAQFEIVSEDGDRSIGSNGSDEKMKMDLSSISFLKPHIVNEKIYLVLWFWSFFLFGASSIMVLYRCCTIVVPSFREYEILYRARKGKSQTIKGLKKHVSLSQWFILSQIGRNSHSKDFNNFLQALRPILLSSITCLLRV